MTIVVRLCILLIVGAALLVLLLAAWTGEALGDWSGLARSRHSPTAAPLPAARGPLPEPQQWREPQQRRERQQRRAP